MSLIPITITFLYINYTLHSITWENVIKYNQLQLPITITPTLVTTKFIMGFDMLQNKMHILVTVQST